MMNDIGELLTRLHVLFEALNHDYHLHDEDHMPSPVPECCARSC